MSWSAVMHVINCCSKTNKMGHLPVCLHILLQLVLTDGLAIVQGTKVLDPVFSEIAKKVSKITSLKSYDVILCLRLPIL